MVNYLEFETVRDSIAIRPDLHSTLVFLHLYRLYLLVVCPFFKRKQLPTLLLILGNGLNRHCTGMDFGEDGKQL